MNVEEKLQVWKLQVWKLKLIEQKLIFYSQTINVIVNIQGTGKLTSTQEFLILTVFLTFDGHSKFKKVYQQKKTFPKSLSNKDWKNYLFEKVNHVFPFFLFCKVQRQISIIVYGSHISPASDKKAADAMIDNFKKTEACLNSL